MAADQHLGMGSIDNRLAIDQHPVAVENDQLESLCRTLDCLTAQARVEER